VNQDLKVIPTVRHMLDHNRCVGLGTDVVTVTVEKSSLIYFILIGNKIRFKQIYSWPHLQL